MSDVTQKATDWLDEFLSSGRLGLSVADIVARLDTKGPIELDFDAAVAIVMDPGQTRAARLLALQQIILISHGEVR